MARREDPNEPAIQVIDAEPGATWGLPRARRPGGRSPHGRLAARLAAGSLVALVAAIGVLGSNPADPSPSPTASASPSPGLEETGLPSANPDACRPVNPDDSIPSFRLAAEGDPIGKRGLQGGITVGDQPAPGPWQFRPPLPWVEVPLDDRLQIIPATAVCITFIDVRAVPFEGEPEPSAGAPQLVRRTAVERGGVASFRANAAGSWSLRVQARYWTGEDRPPAWIEMYFPVRVAPPEPTGPRPLVTAAVPCSPTPADLDALVVALDIGGGPIPGVGFEEAPAASPIRVGLGEPIAMGIVGDACATSWTIDFRQDDVIESLEAMPNPANDPAVASQNHWTSSLPTLGEGLLVITLRFGTDGVIERAWNVEQLPFDVPEAFAIAEDGATVPALPGCGLSFELANGYSAGDSCGALGYGGEGEVLELEAGEPVRFEVPGWTVERWLGQCGRLDDDGAFLTFEAACILGGFEVEGGTQPPPVRFLVPAGVTVLQLGITATRDGDRFTVPYFVPVKVR